MKILVISNPKLEEHIDDKWIAKAFEKDGHQVTLVDKHFNEKLDDEFDIFLKRNCWCDDVNQFEVGADNDAFVRRIVAKNKPRINFDGKFDGKGKHYLSKLYLQGYPVIPTAENLEEFKSLPDSEWYILKPHNGFDGFGMKKVFREGVLNEWNKNYVIQPVINFVAEVQFYFAGNKFEYALRYSPSKYPNWPTPKLYNASEKEIKVAQEFADLSPKYNGVQRIDFLQLANEDLLMLEIEDSSPNISLHMVSKRLRNKYINDYKNMVYEYMKEWQQGNER